MTQDYINSNKIKENKYKILRMSLILGADEAREETITNFEEAAREIDAMNDEIYQKDLEDKFYDTLKLEEEEKKLAVLVDYIGGRVEQRISLLSDFANITGYDLSNLPPIKYYDKLDDYKERLRYIREYLSNTEKINKLTIEIEESEEKLKEAYVNKATSEEYNNRNEEILFSKFTNITKSLEVFKNINEDNIDSKLNEVITSVKDSKKSLDIFVKSFTTLSGSGISYDEELEYKSYVDNAKVAYYTNKEQEYLLRIYKYLLKKETEYSPILIKRAEINDLLYERMALRKELEVEENDILNSIYDLIDRQYKDIERQKDNIETIDYLNNLIETKKEERNDLEQSNQKVEILSLLREFCMIDTYIGTEDNNIVENTENYEEYNNDNIVDNESLPLDTKKEETEVNENNEQVGEIEIKPEDIFGFNNISTEEQEEKIAENQVILVESPKNIDLDLIQSKASKVMKRVGEMLGIKTEETKIVSITAEEAQPKEEVKSVIEDSPFIPNDQLSDENPLFNNTIENIEEQKTPVDPEETEEENNFWFPSDMPDALNALPDLEVSNDNFFTNNSIPDLNFPDLKIDFGSNDSEEK